MMNHRISLSTKHERKEPAKAFPTPKSGANVASLLSGIEHILRVLVQMGCKLLRCRDIIRTLPQS